MRVSFSVENMIVENQAKFLRGRNILGNFEN